MTGCRSRLAGRCRAFWPQTSLGTPGPTPWVRPILKVCQIHQSLFSAVPFLSPALSFFCCWHQTGKWLMRFGQSGSMDTFQVDNGAAASIPMMKQDNYPVKMGVDSDLQCTVNATITAETVDVPALVQLPVCASINVQALGCFPGCHGWCSHPRLAYTQLKYWNTRIKSWRPTVSPLDRSDPDAERCQHVHFSTRRRDVQHDSDRGESDCWVCPGPLHDSASGPGVPRSARP